VATLFRMVYYAFYLSKNIVKRRVRLLAMRSGVNATVLLLVFIVGKRITALFTMTSYGVWALCGIMVTVASMVITVAINVVFYRQNCRALLAAAKRRR